jgi:dihydrofolate synthase/folylpolyglutamate synthase
MIILTKFLKMNYKDTLQYLFSMLPMYQRVGTAAFKKDLTNTLALCSFLNNPQEKLKSVHVAGTNGKGSVSHIIAAILIEAGYKVGLYTSPHLLDFRERIRINGKPVSKEFVIDFTKRIKPQINIIKPSFFEITVAMAFEAFKEERVDFAVIETGLGGRLDSTNVVTPLVSVITNISLEHEQMLGDTLEKIAFEKAGIIKDRTPVVIGEKHEETNHVFKQLAKKRNAEIYFAEDFYHTAYKGIEKNMALFEINGVNGENANYTSDLLGDYQGKNIATSLKAIDILKKANFVNTNGTETKALKKVKSLSGLRGRFEIIRDNPKIICDISHNPKAIENCLKQLRYFSYDSLHIVLGMSNDKQFDKILNQFPKSASYYFVKPDVPRGMDSNNLEDKAKRFSLLGKNCKEVEKGIKSALKEASPEDLVLITGSAFVVAEALDFFNKTDK